jgi:hypothetical protein
MTINENGNAPRHHDRIVPAVLVIAVGVIFLCGNLGVDIPFLDRANWWAWLILAAAAWPLVEAVERYRAVGAVDGAVWHALLNSALIAMVALVFILQLPWRQWWPVFVIYGGLCMLVRDPRQRRRDRER